MGRWVEVADGVLVRRYEELDLSVGLVVGDESCLVVDTGGDAGQGAELGWPGVLDDVLALGAEVVLPGHGDPVDRAFVRDQRAELALVAELCREVAAGSVTAGRAVERSPYPEEFTRAALARPVSPV